MTDQAVKYLSGGHFLVLSCAGVDAAFLQRVLGLKVSPLGDTEG